MDVITLKWVTAVLTLLLLVVLAGLVYCYREMREARVEADRAGRTITSIRLAVLGYARNADKRRDPLNPGPRMTERLFALHSADLHKLVSECLGELNEFKEVEYSLGRALRASSTKTLEIGDPIESVGVQEYPTHTHRT